MPKSYKFLPKGCKFDKSGHTGREQKEEENKNRKLSIPRFGDKSQGLSIKNVLSAVWPELSKFGPFGKILLIFGKQMRVYLVFDNFS